MQTDAKTLLKYDQTTNMYRSESGVSVGREHDTLTPNGNRMNGRWVLRGSDGAMIDFDQNRNDLSERCHLVLDCRGLIV